MIAVNDKGVEAVIWDFRQPQQNVSNRPFYTKLIPSVPTEPIEFHVIHASPLTRYRLDVYRTGYQANDAYSAYIKMGAPKDLSSKQIGELNQLTRDRPEREQTVHSDKDGELTVLVPMRSNDVVLILLHAQPKGID
jgi:xylan 1,4-beta-xylosidase